MYFKNILYICILLSIYYYTILCTEQNGENSQNGKNDVDEIAEMEKTINAIDSAPLDTKFENSRKEIINILKTNESPTEKINNINQLMNHTDFTEEEQVQFYKTLTDAVMSSKNS